MKTLRKKILLVKPDYQYLPIGIAYVARSLVENGIEFDLVDTSINKEPDWNTLLKKGNYGAVATGGLIGSYKFFKNTFKIVKTFDSSLPCILGGNVTADLKSEILFSTMPVDYLVIGESEYTFPELLKALDKKGVDPATVDGIVFRGAAGTMTRTPRRPRVDITTSNRLPYWDCLDIQYYLDKSHQIPIMTGRGCTGRCTFCSPTNGKYMGRPVSHVIEEIKHLNSLYKFESIGFLNEIFFPDDESILEFCQEYNKITPCKSWTCLMRVDMNINVLKVMKEAGFVSGNIGVESGSNRVLKLINKEITVEQIRSFINMTRKLKMSLESSFMMANYGETAEDVKATVDLLVELKASGPMALTINYPGTANYRQAVGRGLIADEIRYLDSLDKLYGRNYYQVISDHRSGKLDYLNLSAMPTPELFRVVEKEMRRYFTDIFEIENARVREIENASWEFVGNCIRCGGEVKNIIPNVSVGYPFNTARCPYCGLVDNYFNPFILKRYKYAFEPVAKAIQNAKRIILFCFDQEFYHFFRYDLFGFNYDAIIGVVGHAGSLSSQIPSLPKGYILNYPILSIDEISRLNPDLLVVPGGFIPEEIRREIYTKCPNLVEQQVSLSLPVHRLFTDSAEYRRQPVQPDSLSSYELRAESVECSDTPEVPATLSFSEHRHIVDTRRDWESFGSKFIAWARKSNFLRAASPFILRTLQSTGYTVIQTKWLEAERASAREEIDRLIEMREVQRTATSTDYIIEMRPLAAIADYPIATLDITYDSIMNWCSGLSDLKDWNLEGIIPVGPHTVLALDGSSSADTFIENTASGQHRLMNVMQGVTEDNPYIFSVYAKAAGRNKLRLELLDTKQKKYGVATYDLLLLKLLTNSGDLIHGGVVQDRDGWVRCWAQASFGGNAASVSLALVNSEVAHDYVGDGKSGLVLWGAQLLPGTALSEVIATSVSTTSENKKVAKYFLDYPQKSLISAKSREFLYNTVRSIHPELVLEVGSFWCGTSEVMARALWENRSGILITIDPFGAERCPSIISQWPEDLQKHVDFRAQSFMEVQPILFSQGKRLDLALIDGNHDYEFALFDIMAAAAIMKPAGLLVVDNADLDGPYWACVDFLKINIGWAEVGLGLERLDPNTPFDIDRASLPETGLIVLKAPQHVFIEHQRPKSFGQDFLSPKILKGIHINLAQNNSGTLHVQMIYRTFGFPEDNIEENKVVDKFNITNDKLVFDLKLKEPLFSKMENAGAKINHSSAEIVLFWQGSDGKPLCLSENPEYSI